MSISSTVSSRSSVRRCTVCGSFLCKWQTHDVCVLHYTEKCVRGGTCDTCCRWSDTEWLRSDETRELRLQRIKDTAVKREKLKAAGKGKSVSSPKSVAQFIPSKSKSSKTPPVEGHSFFAEIDAMSKFKKERRAKGSRRKASHTAVSGDYLSLFWGSTFCCIAYYV